MEQIPKIVQQHLARPQPETHPDADLLTAFSENSLKDRERAELLQHLAVCDHCREVISLSAPQYSAEFESATISLAASAEPVAVAPSRIGLRWGTLVACVVIVAGAVLFSYRPLKKTASRQAELAPDYAKKKNLPMAEMRAGTKPTDRLEADVSTASKQSTTRRIERKSVASLPANGRNLVALQALAPPAAAAPAKDAAKPAEVGQPQSTLSGTFSQQVTVQSEGASIPPSAETVEVTSESPTVEIRKNAGDHVTSEAISGPLRGAKVARLADLGQTRWTLSKGQLQLSRDAGKTFQAVVIENSPTFRALSVMGREIWAGGDKGALYHSPDAGAHWVHVIPSTEDQSLKDDIVRLDFIDADHGKLITSRDGIWSTENCGATWRKQ